MSFVSLSLSLSLSISLKGSAVCSIILSPSFLLRGPSFPSFYMRSSPHPGLGNGGNTGNGGTSLGKRGGGFLHEEGK